MSHLGILLHYPLRHLISQSSNISSEQRIYASRSWTHIDFLIFDKVTHKAKYAIEEGKASVNGEVCAMRGKKIHAGDVVAFGGEEIRVR